MNECKERALAAIEEKQELFCGISDKIWEYAELSLLERRSAALYIDALKAEGFAVTENLGGIETCFSGSFGEGKPIIGILGEFDALSGLSQQANVAEKRPAPGMDTGHGCGHNLLGAGAFAAAVAVKRYLELTKKSGTVVFFGCPGEEGGASKAFLARDGFWKRLDAALTWHPGDTNEVVTGSCSACLQVEYAFSGLAAHAAVEADKGRSALDAVELMNIGVQYLREHMPRSASVHYAVTDAGGVSPNVVQEHARVLYMVRDDEVSGALDLLCRVDRIAEGAALMTGTAMQKRFIDGMANTVPNFALEALLYENLAKCGVPQYLADETAFAQAVYDTYATAKPALPGIGAQYDERIADFVRAQSCGGKKPLNDFRMPPYACTAARPGSTDVGDVSYQTPTAQLSCVTWPSGCPGHSWQVVAMGKSPIAHKGLLCAGRVLAATAIDLLDRPELLTKIRAEFTARTADGYRCPIPEGAVPTVV